MKLVLVLVFLVWAYARFGLSSTSIYTSVDPNHFEQPIVFLAAPDDSFARINIREGPGFEYPISGEIARGQQVVGIAQRSDGQGAYWIELQDGQGFAKRTVLIDTSQ